MDLSIIIVNYNSSGLLKGCLESIIASNLNIEYEIIVVDNNSPDDSLDSLKASYGDVRFLELSQNRGFAAGNNAGIKVAKGKAVALVNPDTVLDPDAIQRLYDKLMSSDKIGIVGPKIFYAGNGLQSEVLPKKIPNLGHLFFEMFWLRRVFPASDTLNSYHGAGSFDFDEEQRLEQVSGACFMIKKEVIDKVGLMDETFFLYFEETDWCLRSLRAGYEIFYVPSAMITHLEGGSASRFSRKAVEKFYESELYFIKKHYGNLRAILLFFLNAGGFAFRLLLTPALLMRERNMAKVRRSFWGLLYHLNLNHLIEVIRS